MTNTIRISSILIMAGLGTLIHGLLFGQGSISGTVYYRGPKTGDIFCEAYDNSDFSGTPVYVTVITDTGPYRIGNVADGKYWMKGFVDANDNGTFDPLIDPVHERGDSCLVQGDSLTGIDLMPDYYPALDNPPLLLGFYIIRLSSSIQAAWPGPEDYLCYTQIKIYHKWSEEYIDSAYAKAPLITGWAGLMHDDGLHWDGNASDSVFGRYQLTDSTEMYIWLYAVDFWLLYAGVAYQPWPAGMEIVWARPAIDNVLAVPELIEPVNGDTVRDLKPDFAWHDNNAEWYEVVVWDTIPMPDNLGSNIVWRAAISGEDTTISMSGYQTQLEHNRTYYWALIAYTDQWSDIASSMEWSYFSVDTSGTGIEELTTDPEKNGFTFFPNPFLCNTSILYRITQRGRVTVDIYDITGRLKSHLFDGFQDAGNHVIPWGGADLPAGVYFCRIQTPDWCVLKKIIRLK